MEVENSGNENSQQEFSTDLLRVYYGRLFPYEQLFNWLSYGNNPDIPDQCIERDYFLNREFSFTIEDDIYIRYQSFRNASEITAAIQKRQPHKIDIGAVFSAPPKDHSTIKPEAFKTLERELVFDIDMTDYDNIRTCCTGANICLRCWPYMTMAIKVIDEALRDDFGFNHILWVYSGRRGVHCWVCDQEARSLANDARIAITEYLSVEIGSADNSDKKIRSSFNPPFHPMIRRAYDILEPFFERCIADGKGQGLLAKKERYMKVLNSLPNDAIRKELYDEWERYPDTSGAIRWKSVVEATTQSINLGRSAGQEQSNKRRKINYADLESWRVELVLTHCYPRLDANVSKSQNHLLKSPFCVHPKTGRVCIPIDPTTAEDFNPFSVPTVRSLCEQVDIYDRENEDAKNIPDVEKTDMKDALDLFQRIFMNKLHVSIRRLLRDKKDKQAAMNIDF